MIGSRNLPSLKPVETKHPHLGADNENSATPILNQIKIFSDMLKSKEEAYRKKILDFNTIKLKVKNARSKMAYLERLAVAGGRGGEVLAVEGSGNEREGV